jgi:hypothetical protein
MEINFPSKISFWLWNENFYENRLGTNFVWILIGFLVAKSVTARKEHYDILLSMETLCTKGSDMNMKRSFVLYCNSFFLLLLDFGLSQLTTSLKFILYHVAGFYKPTIPQSPPSHFAGLQHKPQFQVRVFHKFCSKLWFKWTVPEKWSPLWGF